MKKKTIPADQLSIGNASAYLESESIWGILRGLESFSQLLAVSSDRTAVTYIIKWPVFCSNYFGIISNEEKKVLCYLLL